MAKARERQRRLQMRRKLEILEKEKATDNMLKASKQTMKALIQSKM